jgi:adenine-specific DNA-methyltransferase
VDRNQELQTISPTVLRNIEMSTSRPPMSCRVYTPLPLASAMISSIGSRPRDRWLEPSVGRCAFLQALAQVGVKPDHITALDLDLKRHEHDGLATTFRGVDFLSWARVTENRLDKIVGNPPFVALRQLAPRLRATALAITGPSGERVTLVSNCWYAFLCASLNLLRTGGSLSFVLPAAWEYADYAAEVRNGIAGYFREVEVHRSKKPMFHSVLDGCLVVVGRGFGERSKGVVRFEHECGADVVQALRTQRAIAFGRRAISFATTASPRGARQTGITRPLREILEIRLGGVTGDASYFLMTEQERRSRRLPVRCLRPVLSKARHLVGTQTSLREWSRLRKSGERVWLFSPTKACVKLRSVRAYLRLAPSKGGCRRDRYKVKQRSPWYRIELPRSVDGFLSGMSSVGPWISFRAFRGITATNTLYTVRFRKGLGSEEKAAWALSLLTTQAQHAMSVIKRIYPGQLTKYEPGSLMSVRVPIPSRIRGARAKYSAAVEAILARDFRLSRQIADAWFTRIRS